MNGDTREGSPSVERKNPTTIDLVTLVAGGIVVVGSLLDFYDYSDFGASISRSAWSSDLFSPVTLIPVLCAAVAIVHVALSSFTGVKLPERFLGLGWSQIHVAVGFQATVMMIAFLIQEKDPYGIAIGFWLMLLGSVAMLVAAVGRQRGVTLSD